MTERLRAQSRQTNSGTNPARLKRLMGTYQGLLDKTARTPTGSDELYPLHNKLEMAAYLIRRVNPHVDSVVKIDLVACGLYPGLSEERTPPQIWKNELPQPTEFSIETSHNVMEVLKARLAHVVALRDEMDNDDGSRDTVYRTLAEIRQIEKVSTGKDRGDVKDMAAAFGAGGLFLGATGFFMVEEAIKSTSLKLKILAICVVAGAVVGAAVGALKIWLSKKLWARRAARKDFETEAAETNERVDSRFSRLTAETSEALKACGQGVDELIYTLVDKVEPKVRGRVMRAIEDNTGPYWAASKGQDLV